MINELNQPHGKILDVRPGSCSVCKQPNQPVLFATCSGEHSESIPCVFVVCTRCFVTKVSESVPLIERIQWPVYICLN
jgi:hypothetical protein